MLPELTNYHLTAKTSGGHSATIKLFLSVITISSTCLKLCLLYIKPEIPQQTGPHEWQSCLPLATGCWALLVPNVHRKLLFYRNTLLSGLSLPVVEIKSSSERSHRKLCRPEGKSVHVFLYTYMYISIHIYNHITTISAVLKLWQHLPRVFPLVYHKHAKILIHS